MTGTAVGMDMWLQAISTVGFPIVAFVLMYRFARETVKENTKAVQELKTIVKSQDNGEN